MKHIFIVAIILLFSFEIYSQTDTVGISNKEFYKEYYFEFEKCARNKDFDCAFTYWKKLFKLYPQYKGLYSKGDFLIRTKIKETHNKVVETLKFAKKAQEENMAEEANKHLEQQKQLLAEKELWIDTLLMIYDQRIKYLGDDENYGMGYLKGKKGSYIYEYRKDSALNEAYDLLKESIEIQKEKSIYYVIKDFFDASMDMVKTKKIGHDQIVADYITSMDILKKSTEKFTEYIEKEKKKSSSYENKIKNWKKIIDNNYKVSEYITKYFALSEYFKCEYLISLFKEQFEKGKDVIWLVEAINILEFSGCSDNELYTLFVFELSQTEYFSESAKIIAIDSLKLESYDEAAKYFKIAYILEKDSIKKAENYYYAAVVEFVRNNFSDSRDLALHALIYNPKYCKSYILIAKLYAASAGLCFHDSFERATVYWAAVDKLEKAKIIDASCSEEVDILIEKYSIRFPEKSCMSHLFEGNKYKVGCWIQETTIVRFYK